MSDWPKKPLAEQVLDSAAAQLARNANPFSGIETDALRAVREMDRAMAPTEELQRAIEALRPQKAIADQLASARIAKDLLGRSLEGFGSGLGAASALFELEQKFRLSSPTGFPALETFLKGSSIDPAFVSPFARVRGALSGSVGDDAAGRWERFASATALSTVARLVPDEEPKEPQGPPPPAVLTIAKSGEVGTLAWVTPVAEDSAENDNLISVVALHIVKPPEGPWQKLIVDPNAAVNCMGCGEPFSLPSDFWLTHEGKLYYQGEVWAGGLCPNCSSSPPLPAPRPRGPVARPSWLRVIEGGASEDADMILTLETFDGPEDET